LVGFVRGNEIETVKNNTAFLDISNIENWDALGSELG